MRVIDWSQADDRWQDRVAIVASVIPAGSRVLDLGAGSQVLRAMLPGCQYTAADKHARTPDTLPFDMDEGTYPSGEWDVVVLSGVLEYSPDAKALLRVARRLAPLLVLTYSAQGSRERRRMRTWRTHLTQGALVLLLRHLYGSVRVVGQWESHVVYLAAR